MGWKDVIESMVRKMFFLDFIFSPLVIVRVGESVCTGVYLCPRARAHMQMDFLGCFPFFLCKNAFSFMFRGLLK